MKTSSQYRQQAFESLHGRWTPLVIATLVIGIITIFVSQSTAIVDEKSHPGMVLLLSFVTLIFSVFVASPWQYGLRNATLWYARRDEEASPLDNSVRIAFRSGRYGALVAVAILISLLVLAVCFVGFIVLVLSLVFAIADMDAVATATSSADALSAIFAAMDASSVMPICIGFLLVLIPAFWVQYTYYMAPYIAIDQPTLSAYDCLTASRHMMKGHKWQLFVLQLSFVGWAFLAIFTCFVGFLWLQPYMATADAFFYEDLRSSQEDPAISDHTLADLNAE